MISIGCFHQLSQFLVNFHFCQLKVVAQITTNTPVEYYDTQCSKPMHATQNYDIKLCVSMQGGVGE